MNKVTTTATLEDPSIDALTVVRIELSTHGSKTRINIRKMGEGKAPYSLTLTINTLDIQRALMNEMLDDGK